MDIKEALLIAAPHYTLRVTSYRIMRSNYPCSRNMRVEIDVDGGCYYLDRLIRKPGFVISREIGSSDLLKHILCYFFSPDSSCIV